MTKFVHLPMEESIQVAKITKNQDLNNDKNTSSREE